MHEVIVNKAHSRILWKIHNVSRMQIAVRDSVLVHNQCRLKHLRQQAKRSGQRLLVLHLVKVFVKRHTAAHSDLCNICFESILKVLHTLVTGVILAHT